MTTKVTEQIQQWLDTGFVEALRKEFANWPAHDLADLIAEIDPDKQPLVVQSLDPRRAARAFEFLPFPIQKELLNRLPSPQAGRLLNELSPDDRTSFLEELPPSSVTELLKLLSPDERALTLKLLGYAEDTVGRLMTPEFIAVKLDWTVRQVLDYIREHGRDSETINVIYVVDDIGRLLDDISIREFLLVPPDYFVRQLADFKFLALTVTSDISTAVNLFRRTSRTALPVIDAKGVLVGIVTIDDILQQSHEEDTEDIQKAAGMAALEEPYLEAPFSELMQKRMGWLVFLFLGEMFTATALAFFEEEISKAVVLALFIPLILSSGGNTGSQASTLVTRSLALGEVKLRDWWRVFRREIYSGLFLGTVLGLMGFIRVALGAGISSIYGPHWMLIGFTVAITLAGIVLWATVIGALMPMILKRLGFDPATSSAPLIATFVDVTGIILYFVVALFILQGSLL